jgi:hypothetical protein
MTNPSLPRRLLALCALATLATAVGCSRRHPDDFQCAVTVPRGAPPVGDFSLRRDDWLVGTQTGVWVATVPADVPGMPPVRLGYVVARSHRQVRGGPAFTIYEVTRLDRTVPIGIVDSLGNAKRFKPRRDGHIEVEDAGNSTLALSVGAVFETVKPVTLEATTEHRIAFETLDADKNGFLDAKEYPTIGAARGSPDVNRDGKLDFAEFDALDRP